MNKLLCGVAAIVAAGLGAQAQGALISYKFTSSFGSFEYDRDGFLTGDTTVISNSLASCTSTSPLTACISASFVFSSGTISQGFANSNGFFSVPFSAGGSFAFSNLGTFSFGASREATLTVSELPEPTSWAMMIGGFGAIGTSMRRLRVRKQALANG